jgi:hypothetical protein
MQFAVPQFIDIEPKIIGPITPKQFIILIVTAGAIFLCYKLSDFTLFLIEAAVFSLFGIALAFAKVGHQPIYYFFINAIQKARKPSLRLWRREYILVKEIEGKEKGAEKKNIQQIQPVRGTLSTSKLSQIALLVDTGGEYRMENNGEDPSDDIMRGL